MHEGKVFVDDVRPKNDVPDALEVRKLFELSANLMMVLNFT